MLLLLLNLCKNINISCCKEKMADYNALCRFVICLFGIVVSLYALHVEITKLHDPEFKAMCDINEAISCSKVLTSQYGTGFGIVAPIFGENSALNIPNSIYGIAFYILTMVLGFAKNNPTAAFLLLLTSWLAFIGCIYLACILYFVLYDFCVICITTYVINFLLLFLNHRNFKLVRKPKID